MGNEFMRGLADAAAKDNPDFLAVAEEGRKAIEQIRVELLFSCDGLSDGTSLHFLQALAHLEIARCQLQQAHAAQVSDNVANYDRISLGYGEPK